MSRKLLLAPLTSLALVLSASAADAAEWHRVDSSAHRYLGTPQVVAQTYLTNASSSLGLGTVDLVVQNDLALGSHRTVRFTQQYKGLPVLGAAAAVRVGPDGAVKTAVLDVARNLDVSPVPAIDALVAQAIAQARAGNKALTPQFAPRLAVLPESSGPGKLVWSVDLASVRYLVDAHRGLVVSERSLLVHAQGRVYPVSSVVTPTTADVELVELDVAVPQLLNGWAGNLVVTNWESGGAQGGNLVVNQELTPSQGEDFFYDPPTDPLDATDGFAQVGVFYHLTRMKGFFETRLGLDMTPASWRVVAVANLQEGAMPLDNAFFSPQGIGAPWNAPNLIGIGQGTVFDFADDSDVFLHEFGHYVSHNAIGYNEGQLAISEYGLSPWGGSIDEGIADYFACSENDDPILGEASLALLGAARDLEDTTKVCPSGILGEVHEDGEIIGSFGWSLKTALGTEAGDKLVWGAISMLTPGSSFGDFGRGIQQAAADLVADGTLQAADIQTIDALLAERGLDDCDEELEINDAKPTRTITMFGLDLIGQAFGADCPTVKTVGAELQSLFHFKHTPAPTDESITFRVELDPENGGALDWGIYVRIDEHVGMGPGLVIPGLVELPEIAQYDYQVENITETTAQITIDASSTPPFDPSRTYHMAIGNQNCPLVNATISLGTPVMPTGAGGGGGAGGAGGNGAGGTGAGTGNGGAAPAPEPEDDSGCGCRVAGSPLSSAPWAGLSGLLLAAAALGRRRFRR